MTDQNSLFVYCVLDKKEYVDLKLAFTWLLLLYFAASILVVLLIGSLASLSEDKHLCHIDSFETEGLEMIILYLEYLIG